MTGIRIGYICKKALNRNSLRWTTHTLFSLFPRWTPSQYLPTLQSCLAREKVGDQERLKSLIFKVSHMWVFFFLMGVFERGEKKNGRRRNEGGSRKCGG